MKIFLVEDDVYYAEFIRGSLTGKGFQDIRIFSSAELCLDEIRKNNIPSLIIVDYYLPGMNGLELYSAIKKDHPAVQMIFLSSNTDANLVLDLVKKGIRKYVIKNDHVIASLMALIQENDDLFIDLQ
ncbi:MAG: response regulator [Cyclobacteriaceae bacterium]|nr:response regulator [Cyclobacteriaceae bacterium]